MIPLQAVAQKATDTISEMTNLAGARRADTDAEHRDPSSIFTDLLRVARAYLELPQHIAVLAGRTARLCELIPPLLAALETTSATVGSVSKPTVSGRKPPASTRGGDT